MTLSVSLTAPERPSHWLSKHQCSTQIDTDMQSIFDENVFLSLTYKLFTFDLVTRVNQVTVYSGIRTVCMGENYCTNVSSTVDSVVIIW